MQSPGNSWFVRIDGRIRGPYSMSVMTSMKQRGKITAATEVSADRREWIKAGNLHNLFGEADSAPEMTPDAVDSPAIAGELVVPPLPTAPAPPGLPALPNGNANCFYSLDGVVHGPVPLTSVQSRAESGQLVPTDYIWIEGQPTWIEASKALAFPTPEQGASSWLRAHLAIVTCVAGMSLLLVVIPSWYVISSAGEQERKQKETRLALEEAQENRQREFDKKIARVDKRQTELLATKRHIEEQRNILQQALANISAENRRHEEIIAQMEKYRLQEERIAKEEAELASERNRLEKENTNAINQARADAERQHRDSEYNEDWRHNEKMKEMKKR